MQLLRRAGFRLLSRGGFMADFVLSSEEDAPFRTLRGIVIGGMLAVPLWAGLGSVVWMLVR